LGNYELRITNQYETTKTPRTPRTPRLLLFTNRVRDYELQVRNNWENFLDLWLIIALSAFCYLRDRVLKSLKYETVYELEKIP